jgi:propionyl-CoA carboxylase alpha chain
VGERAVFAKILIANRGEIACRVIRSAKRMGIGTVAVYSEADEGALHTRLADEAVAIGPPAVSESYLNVDALLTAIRETGAEAVHPGYGFLSENAAFAEVLAKEGVTFIGPPVSAIASMGDKLAARKIAAEAGVSIIPGTEDAVADAAAAGEAAREIGYPVMVKAAAGGGGKGMRLVRSEETLASSVQSAINEATSSFGDGRVFVERFIEDPRHIEIQVLADGAGNVIHLGERECSIQRRHQKVIEEAPSPLLDDETRDAMGAQACALAKAVGYSSAGTVEFVADQQRNFYFLEMNTRLQVEHPVTEMVTGIDLVEQQIRIAAGEPLGIGQRDVKRRGWSFECRLYAEDPARGFVPSIGRLVRYRPPEASDAVRVDTGVEEGSEITMFYDPMIAKLVTHGADRSSAIGAMRDALDRYEVRGVAHNLSFLNAIMGEQRFAEGRLSTAFIDDVFGEGFDGTALSDEARAVVVPVAAVAHARVTARAACISGRSESAVSRGNEWVVDLGESTHPVHLLNGSDGVTVAFDNRVVPVESTWQPHEKVFDGTVDGVPLAVQIDRAGPAMTLRWRGFEALARVRTPRAAELAAKMPKKAPLDLSRFLLSPMPGLVVALPVAEGETVRAGQPLAVVDAMKMENVLHAERDGRIAKICTGVGDSLAVDQVIMEFE